ncbi:MarR family winged helix-turn-helix transcriptional regulator [Paenibacillus caseinilyticus]|uniref:MarR family transcriptional regulator n=2 Tax=Paenibacillus mucilaginosus TaxID=61624 RepID=I0BDT7_9BACL|nr:MarR family transcriptional regulator [Paenibacillus mucilaginosus]AFH60534.1 MarR family transcriptional regulator [Paenibacillus mucilaginosus K02]
MERQDDETQLERKNGESSTNERYPVSFAIFMLARAHRGLAAQMLREIGLFAGQEIMLMQLWDQDSQSQQSLGRLIGLDHSTVAKSVKRMEEAGLVTRTRSPQDKRVTLVSLTDSGRELEAKVNDIWNRLERITAERLTEKERRLLVSLSYKIAAAIDEANSNSVSEE